MRISRILLFGAVLSLSNFLWATTISMETTIETTVKTGSLNVTVNLANKGDEEAYSVQIKAEGQGFAWESPVQKVHPHNHVHTARFAQSLKATLPGRYPLLLRVRYKDANQYPFTAISATTYTVGKDASEGVLGVLEEAVVEKSARLTLKLKNLDSAPKKLQIRFFLPDELSAEPSQLEKDLGPSEETSAVFSVKNFSALSDSSYPIYAVIEYDQNNLHQTALALGSVQVVERTLLERYKFLLWALFAVVLVAVLILNVRRK